jgi:hypothetical protein
VITDFKFEFYGDIIKKRKLSEKQSAIKSKINEKLLIFTSYENNSVHGKINLVLKWSETHKWFNNFFIHSLKNSYERKGILTEKQSIAHENIILKNRISE